jgi:hypothetical protein
MDIRVSDTGRSNGNGLKIENWFVSASEVGSDVAALRERLMLLRSDDELSKSASEMYDGAPTGRSWTVVALRNGTVTRRNAADNLSIPDHIAEALYYSGPVTHPRTGETSMGWVEVAVNSDGSFADLLSACLYGYTRQPFRDPENDLAEMPDDPEPAILGFR